MLGARSRSFTIGTVVASNHRGDLSNLDSLLRGSAWKLIQASTCGEAKQALGRQRVPIVLCDVALEDQPWQMTLRKLREARSECAVVFLSNKPGPDFSPETAEHGEWGRSGLTLLVRPLKRELVFHSLFLAYGRWLSRLVYTQGYLGRYVAEGGPAGPFALSKRNTVRTR